MEFLVITEKKATTTTNQYLLHNDYCYFSSRYGISDVDFMLNAKDARFYDDHNTSFEIE